MDNQSNELQPLSEQLEKANELSEELRPIILACEKFTKGLNGKPLKIKERMGTKYIPISAVEVSLDRMFTGLWSTKNAEWRLIANEVVYSLELHYFHPIAKVWLSRCGVGAAQMRMKSGSEITDINAKIKNALEMDVAHAKADALKNAAKSIGDLFGRNIARPERDATQYTPMVLDVTQIGGAKEQINAATNLVDLAKVWAKNKAWHGNKTLQDLFDDCTRTLQAMEQ